MREKETAAAAAAAAHLKKEPNKVIAEKAAGEAPCRDSIVRERTGRDGETGENETGDRTIAEKQAKLDSEILTHIGMNLFHLRFLHSFGI